MKFTNAGELVVSASLPEIILNQKEKYQNTFQQEMNSLSKYRTLKYVA